MVNISRSNHQGSGSAKSRSGGIPFSFYWKTSHSHLRNHSLSMAQHRVQELFNCAIHGYWRKISIPVSTLGRSSLVWPGQCKLHPASQPASQRALKYSAAPRPRRNNIMRDTFLFVFILPWIVISTLLQQNHSLPVVCVWLQLTSDHHRRSIYIYVGTPSKITALPPCDWFP